MLVAQDYMTDFYRDEIHKLRFISSQIEKNKYECVKPNLAYFLNYLGMDFR